MKAQIRPIDRTDCGPIQDRDGYMDTSGNVRSVMAALHEDGFLSLPARTKVVVLQSRVRNGGTSDATRYEVEIVRTLGYLRHLYADFFGKEFNAREFVQEKTFELEARRKQGEKEWAFAAYTHVVREHKRQQEAREILKPFDLQDVVS